MGSSTILDILGSMIVGALLVLSLGRLYTNASMNSSQFNMETIVERNLVDVFDIMENDLLKIGYLRGQENLTYSGQVIQVADTNRIVFLADVANAGNFQTIEYRVGSRDSLLNTANPFDLPFFRRVNSADRMMGSYGITQFRLEYFDYVGNRLVTPVQNRGQIATLSITVAVESPFLSDRDFPEYNAKAYWKQVRLAIPNLRYK